MFPITPTLDRIQTCEDVENVSRYGMQGKDMSKLNVSAEAFIPVSPWMPLHAVPSRAIRAWLEQPRYVFVVACNDAMLEVKRMQTEFALIFPWLRTMHIKHIDPVCDASNRESIQMAFLQHKLKKLSHVPSCNVCVISEHPCSENVTRHPNVTAWLRSLGVNVDTHDDRRNVNVEQSTKLRYNPWLRTVEQL